MYPFPYDAAVADDGGYLVPPRFVKTLWRAMWPRRVHLRVGDRFFDPDLIPDEGPYDMRRGVATVLSVKQGRVRFSVATPRGPEIREQSCSRFKKKRGAFHIKPPRPSPPRAEVPELSLRPFPKFREFIAAVKRQHDYNLTGGHSPGCPGIAGGACDCGGPTS